MTTALHASQCPICGKVDCLDVCFPYGYAICPTCEFLAYVVRKQLHHESGVALDDIRLESLLADDLGLESLEDVEAIFAIEEKLGIKDPRDLEGSFPQTVRDIIEYLRRCQEEQ